MEMPKAATLSTIHKPPTDAQVNAAMNAAGAAFSAGNSETEQMRAAITAALRVEPDAPDPLSAPPGALRRTKPDPVKETFGFLLMFVVGCIAAELLLWLVGRSH